ncbi:hypothetical protein MRB53_035874 [Persea americana]|uniref:Uncharacterized protein n=1 Tax=Persea americana TaxID=3435 RepID=A0ACC2K6B4_PERAE|nr:hypothetical protein MRB53_035874 [Persea americana]
MLTPPECSSSSPPQTPLSWPSGGNITLDWIKELTAAFNWSSWNLNPEEFPEVFPLSVFIRLTLKASKILQTEPNCVTVNERGLHDSTVVVVGDLHGQFHDMVFLMNDVGLPSEKRFYVFNGDYVDRGAWGLEVFIVLLAWKVFLPHRVFILRGNHESLYCSSLYGFKKEVMSKYGNKGNKVYKECISMLVSAAKRRKGKKLSNLIPGDVLWSDPSMCPGLSPNEERGIGLLWGPDCTEEFLKKNDLKLIIRSHEGPDAREKRAGLSGMVKGYTIDHEVASGKLITVFSAPDYPQFQATTERYNNNGAYIVLEPPDFATPVFHTFEAITPRPKVNAYYDYHEVPDSDGELDLASMADDSLSEDPSLVLPQSEILEEKEDLEREMVEMKRKWKEEKQEMERKQREKEFEYERRMQEMERKLEEKRDMEIKLKEKEELERSLQSRLADMEQIIQILTNQNQQPDLQEGAASLQNELANLKSREAAASNEATLLRDRVKCLENALLEKEVTWQQKKREWAASWASLSQRAIAQGSMLSGGDGSSTSVDLDQLHHLYANDKDLARERKELRAIFLAWTNYMAVHAAEENSIRDKFSEEVSRLKVEASKLRQELVTVNTELLRTRANHSKEVRKMMSDYRDQMPMPFPV